ncbi:hypothetical protein HGRIS_003202 [Hohenbuehelia grisea]|uniref:Uncharacterized protein n=1 Tax=Hohenbuehelia grisea TaxID=104357 RepID=A0ABR3JMR0_9AGAR
MARSPSVRYHRPAFAPHMRLHTPVEISYDGQTYPYSQIPVFYHRASSMSLQAGSYGLTQSPLWQPGMVGGMYVTGNGTYQPVMTAPLHPKYFHKQSWNIRPVDGSSDNYHITLKTNTKEAPVSFGFENAKDVRAGTRVVLSHSPIDWVINAIENPPVAEKTFISIKPSGHEDLFVTVDKDNTLYLVNKPEGEVPFFYAMPHTE